MGEGLLLDYVVKKADSGADLEDAAKFAEDLKLKICHHFTVDNLFHLKRGGRVSSATAVIGSILNIKPIMRVDDGGKLVSVGKAMGRKKSLHSLVERLFASMDMDEDDPIFISHGDCIEDVEYVKNLILARMPNVEIKVHYVGSVIGAHSGAGTLAIFHKGTHSAQVHFAVLQGDCMEFHAEIRQRAAAFFTVAANYGQEGIVGHAGEGKQDVAGTEQTEENDGDGVGTGDDLGTHKAGVAAEDTGGQGINDVSAAVTVAIAGGRHKMRLTDTMTDICGQHLLLIILGNAVNGGKSFLRRCFGTGRNSRQPLVYFEKLGIHRSS
jgi:hypothetical protein